MKILIVTSKNGRVSQYAEALRLGAEAKGHQVTFKVADERGDTLTARLYDLILVGSPIMGLLGGKVAPDMITYLHALKGLEGRDAIAFTSWKPLGTDKALRKLMEVMEAQGCVVKDFQAFRNTAEAKAFGNKL